MKGIPCSKLMTIMNWKKISAITAGAVLVGVIVAFTIPSSAMAGLPIECFYYDKIEFIPTVTLKHFEEAPNVPKNTVAVVWCPDNPQTVDDQKAALVDCLNDKGIFKGAEQSIKKSHISEILEDRPALSCVFTGLML